MEDEIFSHEKNHGLSSTKNWGSTLASGGIALTG